ncbi:MAG TPA: GGDEF domain-containing protein, partial [Fimbriimonadaceae bacterium]|nr:GGDEF domain-containing protein [Fimbriimonadaceae bacterium]
MAFFKRDKPEFKTTEWQALSESDLKERISPLLAYLASALHSTLGLMVSPGSKESKKYVRDVDEAVRRLTETPLSPGTIESCRTAYAEASDEFGVWQREQVDSFKSDVAETVESIVSSAKEAFVGQDETLSGLDAIGRHLRTASQSDDVVQMRAVLRQESERARELFVRQRDAHQELQDDFDESIRDLEQRLTAVEGVGSKDYLTECANRASLDFYITAICRKAQIETKCYSVAMLDLDDFKGVNDVWGHQVGDRALGELVRTLKREFPTRAFIGRYGGDEF